MFTKEIGSMIRLKVLGSILIKMGHSTRDSGRKINRTERARKHGQMGLCTMAITCMARSMG
jgi:hypothetical protein